jgi:NAD(P)-dependent dehydrogenase (short-subunit alcohol dehydrogenase family)
MRDGGSLAGATAIITGASSGIRYGVASRLAADGAAVAINYHSQREPAEQLKGEIERGGGRAIVVGGDVSKEADVASLSIGRSRHSARWTFSSRTPARRRTPGLRI